jgi:hypothetical protein
MNSAELLVLSVCQRPDAPPPTDLLLFMEVGNDAFLSCSNRPVKPKSFWLPLQNEKDSFVHYPLMLANED